MLDANPCYASRIIVSHDISKKNRLLSYGGTGYGHLIRTVQNQATDVAQINPVDWFKITHSNPQTWLTTTID